MAFKFFRRRQKLVVVIMAALMVSFLLGSWGMNMLFRAQRKESAIGTTRWGDIKESDLVLAQRDIGVLRTCANLRRLRSKEFFALLRNPSTDLIYAILLKEAASNDVLVTDEDVDELFTVMGATVGGEDYKILFSIVKLRTKLTAKYIHAALKRWLGVQKAHRFSLVSVPPSEPELRRLFRDVTEKIDLHIVAVTAGDFLDEVPEPNQKQIAEQFERFRSVAMGAYSEVGSFGFGYYQPDRVRLRYLFVDRSVVERVVAPSDEAVRRYYRAHRSEFVREVPIARESSESPAQTSTEPSAQPVQVRTEEMQFSEAKEQIVLLLKESAVRNRMDELLTRAETLLGGYETTDATEIGPYERVKDRLTLPPTDALERKLGSVSIHNESLEKAMERLSEAAGLRAICYPFGLTKQGGLDPSVKVSLSARDITLSEALNKITKQVRWGEVRWVMCEGFDNVLFADQADSRFFPIRVAQSELSSFEELSADDLFANSVTPAGLTLPQVAFQTDAFGEGRRSMVRVDEDGPRMEVRTERGGRLLWRLSETHPAHTPEQLTDKLRKKVIEDIKVREAFQLALAEAEKLMSAGQKAGLKAAAKTAGLKTTETGLFARKTISSPLAQLAILVGQGLITQEEAMVRWLYQQPVIIEWSQLPDISTPTDELRKHFLEAAFSLVPEDVEPKPGDEPYPQTPPALTSVELPASHEVLILQRVGYHPAVAVDYEKTGRTEFTWVLKSLRDWEARIAWFGWEDVETRSGFERAEPEGG